MKKYLYVSRINYRNSSSAQAVQIRSMISNFPASRIKLDVAYPKEKAGFIFYLKVTFRLLRFNYNLIICRDLVTFLISVIFRVNCLYEAHLLPKNKFIKVIHKIISKSKVSHLGPISNKLESHYKKIGYKNTVLIRSAINSVYRYCSLETKEAFYSKLNIKHKSPYYILMHTGSAYFGRGVEVCAALLNDPRILFVQVGGNLKDILRIKSQINNSNLERFIWIQNCSHSESLQLQCLADILLYSLTPEWPSYEFASSLKSIEYLSTGNPIIGTNGGGVFEVYSQAKTFTTANFSSLNATNVLNNCINNASLWTEYALHNYNLSLQYTWDERWMSICDYAEKHLIKS